MATIIDRKNSKGQNVFDVVYGYRKDQWSRTCPDKMTADVKGKEVDAKIAKMKQGSLTPPIHLDKKAMGRWLWNGEVASVDPTQNPVPVATGTPPTLGQLIKGYLTSSFYQDKATHTKRGEKTKTNHLLRLLGEKTLLQTLNEKMLQKYIDTRRTEDGKQRKNEVKGERKVVGKTVKKELDVLRAIWNGYGLQQDLVFREWRPTFKKKLYYGKMSAKALPKTLAEPLIDGKHLMSGAELTDV